jgi:hypothetical protein
MKASAGKLQKTKPIQCNQLMPKSKMAAPFGAAWQKNG